MTSNTETNTTPKKTRRSKSVAAIVIVLILALVAGSIAWFVSSQSKSEVNQKWDTAATQTANQFISLSNTVMAAKELEEQLTQVNQDRNSTADITELNEAIVESENLLNQFLETNPSFATTTEDERFTNVINTEEVILLNEPAQSENNARTPAQMLAELTSDSTETATQSGSIPTVELTTEVFYLPADSQTVAQTEENAELLMQWKAQFEEAQKALTSAANNALEVTYQEALVTAQTALIETNTALTTQIATAETLLADSDGKVADNATREALTTTIATAKEAASNNDTSDMTLSLTEAATKANTDATTELTTAMDKVTSSMQQKATDDAAAAQATTPPASASSNSNTGNSSNNTATRPQTSTGSKPSTGGTSKPSTGNTGKPSTGSTTPKPAPKPSKPGIDQPYTEDGTYDWGGPSGSTWCNSSDGTTWRPDANGSCKR